MDLARQSADFDQRSASSSASANFHEQAVRVSPRISRILADPRPQAVASAVRTYLTGAGGDHCPLHRVKREGELARGTVRANMFGRNIQRKNVRIRWVVKTKEIKVPRLTVEISAFQGSTATVCQSSLPLKCTKSG